MIAVDVLVGLAGAALVVVSLGDLFQSVVVPRSTASRWRVSAYISRFSWRVWRGAAMRIRDAERREDRLAMFAPALLVSLLLYWVVAEIVGIGLVFWALRGGIRPEPGVGDALYFAGTSLLTIGYGDLVPTAWYTRVLAICAAMAGLATFAIVATFLFQIFAAFQRREAFVVTLSDRAGAPPSGVEFLIRHARLGLLAGMNDVLRGGQRWMAEVLETHLAYPVLTFFRSSHDDESWIGTVGALLDASILLITTTEIDHRGEAELTAKAGTHLVRDFEHFFNLEGGEEAGVDYDELLTAYRALREAGIPVRPADDAWPAFAQRRASYAAQLDALARWLRIPPARWIGDRSRVRLHINAGVPR